MVCMHVLNLNLIQICLDLSLELVIKLEHHVGKQNYVEQTYFIEVFLVGQITAGCSNGKAKLRYKDESSCHSMQNHIIDAIRRFL